MSATRIVKSYSPLEFEELRQEYKEHIQVNPHALFRLSDAQRKIFKAEQLLDIVRNETPRGYGLQKNGLHAVFFRRKEGFTRIMFQVLPGSIEIVTFVITDTMPVLK